MSIFRKHRLSASIGRSDAGFTLLELLVVLGILALLATFVGPAVLRYMGKARTDTARTQISAIASAVELYALDMGKPPATELGLNALVTAPQGVANWKGPYLKSASGLTDPWGHPYHYRSPGKNAAYEIFSYGEDNMPNGDGEAQDLVSW
ncbi:MAG: type II secretion system major pseudopilin GspG [Hyphomicrobiaceae bacterium]